METDEIFLETVVFISMSDLTDNNIILGNKFRNTRKELGLSVHDVSFILCCHPSMILELERGLLKYIPVTFLKRLLMLYRKRCFFNEII